MRPRPPHASTDFRASRASGHRPGSSSPRSRSRSAARPGRLDAAHARRLPRAARSRRGRPSPGHRHPTAEPRLRHPQGARVRSPPDPGHGRLAGHARHRRKPRRGRAPRHRRRRRALVHGGARRIGLDDTLQVPWTALIAIAVAGGALANALAHSPPGLPTRDPGRRHPPDGVDHPQDPSDTRRTGWRSLGRYSVSTSFAQSIQGPSPDGLEGSAWEVLRVPDLELATVDRESVLHADEHPDGARIEQRHVGEVDDESTPKRRKTPSQLIAIGEVQLARQVHDRAPGFVDDRKSLQTGHQRTSHARRPRRVQRMCVRTVAPPSHALNSVYFFCCRRGVSSNQTVLPAAHASTPHGSPIRRRGASRSLSASTDPAVARRVHRCWRRPPRRATNRASRTRTVIAEPTWSTTFATSSVVSSSDTCPRPSRFWVCNLRAGTPTGYAEPSKKQGRSSRVRAMEPPSIGAAEALPTVEVQNSPLTSPSSQDGRRRGYPPSTFLTPLGGPSATDELRGEGGGAQCGAAVGCQLP